MGTGTNKILISGLNTSQPGAYWQYANVTAGVGNATGGLATIIPPGTYIAVPTTGVALAIEVNLQTANVNAWTSLYGNGTGGLIVSDGQNVRANGTGTMVMLVVDPGSAANVTGTFNAT